MINSEFDTMNYDTDEGKMLFAALSILTSIEHGDITSQKYGGMSHIHDVFESVMNLSNKIYHPEEYEIKLSIDKRNEKINELLK